MENEFSKLASHNHLVGLNKEEFVKVAADLAVKINAIHPFIEGTGRVLRTWLRLVAANAGYSFTFLPEDRVVWNEASRIGHINADNRPMERVLTTCLSRLLTLSPLIAATVTSPDDLSKAAVKASFFAPNR